jgi:hypothetical protein
MIPCSISRDYRMAIPFFLAFSYRGETFSEVFAFAEGK